MDNLKRYIMNTFYDNVNSTHRTIVILLCAYMEYVLTNDSYHHVRTVSYDNIVWC